MIQILTRFPDVNSTGASRETYIFIGATNPVGGLSPDTLRVTIAGEIAYQNREFNKPAFDGQIFLNNNYVAIRIQPRRAFDFAEQVDVVTNLTDTQQPPVSTLVDSFVFYVSDKSPTTVNAATLAPCQRRFLTAFPDPHLDVYRQLMGSTLSPNPSLTALVAAYRLEESISRPLVVPLQLTIPTNLLDRDITPLLAVDSQVIAQMALWESALKELQSLGVGEQTVDTLRRAMNSDYPHNHVGAVCGATLLAGAFYAAQNL